MRQRPELKVFRKERQLKRKRTYTDIVENDILQALGLKAEGDGGDDDEKPSVKHGSNIHRENNHIYFYSDITRKTIYELTTLLREAEEENVLTAFKMGIDPIPIYLHIFSYGGCLTASFHGVDSIENCSVPVYSIVEGGSASGGTILSIACKKRFITKNSYMLIHQLSAGCWGKMEELEDDYKNNKQSMEQLKKFYKDRTKLKTKQLNELLKHDLWLDAEKCIEYGLADEYKMGA